MEKKVLFRIKDNDANGFLRVLEDFYRFYKNKPEVEAKSLAAAGFANLISGNDLDGKKITNPNLVYFDEILSVVTENYYTPSQTARYRYKKASRSTFGRPKKTTKTSTQILSPEESKETEKKIDRIKHNLLTEYPTLDRIDLEENIDNYCKLIVKINELMSEAAADNTMAIKNLTDTQIKLGSFLGIDEGEKAKQKSIDDQQSVASLSSKFQRTIDEFPEIMDRMRYKELRILLEKYDRQEISRELFENSAYAGVTVDAAREFIKKREAKYEAS